MRLSILNRRLIAMRRLSVCEGATPVAIKLTVPDFAVNWDEVRAAITPRTRMIIINTPHNPSGQVFSRADWSNWLRSPAIRIS